MNFLLSACENPDILRVIYFIEKILNIVFIVIPIGLIVMVTIDVVKMIISGEKEQAKSMKTIITRIILAVAIFFVPTIVNIVTNVIEKSGVADASKYKNCLNVTKEKINKQQQIWNQQNK